jgi:hypothetical protein
VASFIDDTDDAVAAQALQITNGDHNPPSDPTDPMNTTYRAVAAEHGPGVYAGPSRLISVPRASTDLMAGRVAGRVARGPDSAIAKKKKKRPEAAEAAKSARRAVAKEAAETAERSNLNATVLGELMRLETCTHQQVQMAREFLDRFGCAGTLTIGELRSRVGLDNVASWALLEMQLSRHGRSKEAIEALVSFLSGIGIVVDMAAAMRESDQRASAFIASRFPAARSNARIYSWIFSLS